LQSSNSIFGIIINILVFLQEMVMAVQLIVKEFNESIIKERIKKVQ